MGKWITKNQATIFRIFVIIFLFIGIAIAKFTNVGSLVTCAIYVMLVVLIFAALNIITAKTTQRLMSIFEETCDPTEIFDLLEHTYKRYSNNIVYQINHSFVLSFSGRKHEQKAFLEGIDITKHTKNSWVCFVYYNNLFDAYCALNEQDKMEQAYINAVNFYNAIKNKKQKEAYEKSLNAINLDHAIAKGDVEKAIYCIGNSTQDKLLYKVEYFLSMAKIYILQNETEKAREHLIFVIQNASKIVHGKEAEKLLEKIS